MSEIFKRTEMLIGKESVKKLSSCHVAVFGVGGVGGYVVEALVRSGVGELTLVDGDTVAESNINRQIIALHSTVGMPKTLAAKQRCLDINPNVKINEYNIFFDKTNSNDIDFTKFDYVVDAIDTVSSKILIVKICDEKGIPVISAMGAGNKLDPCAFEVCDVFKTSGCPLARVMRSELRKMGIKKLKTVFSQEKARTPLFRDDNETTRRQTPASIAFVPSVAGLIIGGEVIKDLIGDLYEH